MKATELLEKQHKVVAKLFKKIERATDPGQKSAYFEELAHCLVAHDAIEREIFYPACEAEMGLTDMLGEALVEHGVVEFCLYQAGMARGRPDFDFKMTVLEEVVSHHVEEEEEEFFPKVRRALGAARLEELTAPMEARFEAAKASDFQAPLVENLRKVLAGTIKPAKEKPVPPAKKTRASKGARATAHHAS